MKYVYILESLDCLHHYTGVTDDLRKRMEKTMPEKSRTHQSLNLGASRHTPASPSRHRHSRLKNI